MKVLFGALTLLCQKYVSVLLTVVRLSPFRQKPFLGSAYFLRDTPFNALYTLCAALLPVGAVYGGAEARAGAPDSPVAAAGHGGGPRQGPGGRYGRLP